MMLMVTMMVLLFPSKGNLYLYALLAIVCIVWWLDADGYHDGLAVTPQGILEKHCQGRVSVRNPHLRFSHQDFVLALKKVSKDINLRNKIITIAYISSPFDPLIVWLAQISHFPGWNLFEYCNNWQIYAIPCSSSIDNEIETSQKLSSIMFHGYLTGVDCVKRCQTLQ